MDENANIIYGTTCDERLEGLIRVSIVATGIDVDSAISPEPLEKPAVLSIDNSVYKQKETSLDNEVINESLHSSGHHEEIVAKDELLSEIPISFT